jgi:hypothetical protein
MLNAGADGVLSASEVLPSARHVPELHVACERPHRMREESGQLTPFCRCRRWVPLAWIDVTPLG